MAVHVLTRMLCGVDRKSFALVPTRRRRMIIRPYKSGGEFHDCVRTIYHGVERARHAVPLGVRFPALRAVSISDMNASQSIMALRATSIAHLR